MPARVPPAPAAANAAVRNADCVSTPTLCVASGKSSIRNCDPHRYLLPSRPRLSLGLADAPLYTPPVLGLAVGAQNTVPGLTFAAFRDHTARMARKMLANHSYHAPATAAAAAAGAGACTAARGRYHSGPKPALALAASLKGGLRGPRKWRRISAWNQVSTVACCRASAAHAGMPLGACGAACAAAAGVDAAACTAGAGADVGALALRSALSLASVSCPCPARAYCSCCCCCSLPGQAASKCASWCRWCSQRTPAPQWLISSAYITRSSRSALAASPFLLLKRRMQRSPFEHAHSWWRSNCAHAHEKAPPTGHASDMV